MKRNRFATEIVLGERYRESVTGFEGTATAIVFFLNGCERVTLERWFEDKGELRELTFDAPRLLHQPSQKPVVVSRTGGVRPGPTRSSANR